MESHGNHTISASRVFRTARDLVSARAALDGEERLARVIKVRKPGPVATEENCGAIRKGYGMGCAGSLQVCGG